MACGNGAGIIASLIGIILVRNTNLKDNATLESLLATITNGVWVASAATTGFTALAVALLFKQDLAWKLFGSTVIGLVALLVGLAWAIKNSSPQQERNE
jgi:hypothetical protein